MKRLGFRIHSAYRFATSTARIPYRAWLRWRLCKAIRILDSLDYSMWELGWTRTQRRQFWRDFTKRRTLREDVLNQLTPR